MPVEFRAMISFPACQRGIASLMVILLTGMTLTIAALGMMYMVQGTQERQLAVHATTPAQLKAWTGVELLRQFLTNRSTNDLEALAAGEIAVGGTEGLRVELLSKTKPKSDQYRIVANVTGRAADSTAIVQAIFDVNPLDYTSTGTGPTTGAASGATSPSSPASVPPLIRISTDLNLNGSVSFEGPQQANISVKGKVNLSGNVTGLDAISSTDDITVGSSVSVSSLTTNGNVTLEGNASALTVSAIKNVTLTGNASAGTVTANGTLNMAGRQISTANVTGSVNISSGAITTLNSQADVFWTSKDSAREINTNGKVTYSGSNNGTAVAAIGDVRIDDGTVQTVRTQGNTVIDRGEIISRLDGQGALTANTAVVASGTVGGALTVDKNSKVNVVRTVNYQVNVPRVTVQTVKETVVQTSKVDAYQLRSNANYVFQLSSTGQRQVTVQGVSGIANGVYLLGNYPDAGGRGYRDFLCNEVNAQGMCTAPLQPNKTICQGATTFNGCITYRDGLWSLSGWSLAPGVLWFQGDVQAGSGVYYNSIIATGNIATTAKNKTIAVNYAGFDPICRNTRRAEDNVPASLDLAGLYPLNLCDIAKGLYKPSAVGNVALLAGGYLNGTFSGGMVTLGASNDVYGSVVAGNNVVTTGNTRVHGTITSAAQGGGIQQLGGSTTIDTTAWPSTFSPEQAPGNAPEGSGTTNSGAMYDIGRAQPTVQILWTRYL
ncbi:hypothetical protein [Pseudomonas sp.]|uniref:hypothetical protein n=1 Tax=Pseudomonas sp. TaxID=306 RepID=UPI0028A95932|nr:hypothetical protein [Pseudomonas sp.]